MFEIKTQLIDTDNKILTHRCLYMEDINLHYNRTWSVCLFVCEFVHDNLRNGLTDLNPFLFAFWQSALKYLMLALF